MKKLLTILVLIMLIISFFQITKMYALYKEEMQGEYNTLLGGWTIKINETDVTTSGQVENFTITGNRLGSVASEGIQTGKIAPGGQSYFDIIIDPSKTDVSIIYTIDVDLLGSTTTNPNVNLKNSIEIIKCENYFGQGDDGQTNKVLNDSSIQKENQYTAILPLEKIKQGYKNYIRIYFKWNNLMKDNVEINNDIDTALGSIDGAKISIPLQISLKQYSGEVISNEQ